MIGFFYAVFWHKSRNPFTGLTLGRLMAFWNSFWHKAAEPNNFIRMKTKMYTIYQQAERFAEITKNAIITGNIARARKCLDKAGQLFEMGSSETKNVISNVYVYSVSTFMEIRHCSISNLFPQNLKTEYLKQINTGGV